MMFLRFISALWILAGSLGALHAEEEAAGGQACAYELIMEAHHDLLVCGHNFSVGIEKKYAEISAELRSYILRSGGDNAQEWMRGLDQKIKMTKRQVDCSGEQYDDAKSLWMILLSDRSLSSLRESMRTVSDPFSGTCL